MLTWLSSMAFDIESSAAVMLPCNFRRNPDRDIKTLSRLGTGIELDGMSQDMEG